MSLRAPRGSIFGWPPSALSILEHAYLFAASRHHQSGPLPALTPNLWVWGMCACMPSSHLKRVGGGRGSRAPVNPAASVRPFAGCRRRNLATDFPMVTKRGLDWNLPRGHFSHPSRVSICIRLTGKGGWTFSLFVIEEAPPLNRANFFTPLMYPGRCAHSGRRPFRGLHMHTSRIYTVPRRHIFPPIERTQMHQAAPGSGISRLRRESLSSRLQDFCPGMPLSVSGYAPRVSSGPDGQRPCNSAMPVSGAGDSSCSPRLGG